MAPTSSTRKRTPKTLTVVTEAIRSREKEGHGQSCSIVAVKNFVNSNYGDRAESILNNLKAAIEEGLESGILQGELLLQRPKGAEGQHGMVGSLMLGSGHLKPSATPTARKSAKTGPSKDALAPSTRTPKRVGKSSIKKSSPEIAESISSSTVSTKRPVKAGKEYKGKEAKAPVAQAQPKATAKPRGRPRKASTTAETKNVTTRNRSRTRSPAKTSAAARKAASPAPPRNRGTNVDRRRSQSAAAMTSTRTAQTEEQPSTSKVVLFTRSPLPKPQNHVRINEDSLVVRPQRAGSVPPRVSLTPSLGSKSPMYASNTASYCVDDSQYPDTDVTFNVDSDWNDRSPTPKPTNITPKILANSRSTITLQGPSTTAAASTSRTTSHKVTTKSAAVAAKRTTTSTKTSAKSKIAKGKKDSPSAKKLSPLDPLFQHPNNTKNKATVGRSAREE